MVLTGHCLCKAVTYKVDVDAPIITGYDHCDDCQRQTGSTYCEFPPEFFSAQKPPHSSSAPLHRGGSPAGDDVVCATTPTRPRQPSAGQARTLVVVVPKDKLTINGPTKSWAGKGSSGKAVHRIFCSECGSPIAHDPDAVPEIIALKGGTLDAEIKKTLKPDTEIWTVGKLPFCQESLAKPFTHMPKEG
ncbi:hypothetical protein RB593_002786 [Gaeumannomyces tritici]